MNDASPLPADESQYRKILGVRFFTGDCPQAVELGARGGLVVVPAAPALVELGRDSEDRQALLEADLVITDSGFMVIRWNLIMGHRLHRVPGLEYREWLLRRSEFKEPGATLWIMPSKESMD